MYELEPWAIRKQFTVAGVDVPTYIGVVLVDILKLTPEAVAIIPHLREKLGDIGVNVNVVKTVDLPPQPGHAPAETDLVLSDSVGWGGGY